MISAGVLWNSDTVVKLAKKAVIAENIEFQGMYLHCGNSYNSDKKDREKIQNDTTERMLELKDRLAECDF